MLKQKLDAIVDSYKDQILSDIQKWVAVPSVAGEPEENAPFGREVRRALDTALETAKGYGFATRDLDGYCGEVTLCEGRQTLGMLCHLDVVPAGDGWTETPGAERLPTGKSSAGAPWTTRARRWRRCTPCGPCGRRAFPWPTA